jgi:hypothetical protein
MVNSLTEEEKRNVLTLYTLLCSNKEASIKYLVETGKICKIEDSNLRKNVYRKNMRDFLNALNQS